jgi:hypothetical protein
MRRVSLVPVLLSLLLSTRAWADDGVWSFGVAPRFGVTVPTSKLGTTFESGLELDVPLPFWSRSLTLALDASLTQPSYDGAATDPRTGGTYTFSVEETELKVALDAVYRVGGGRLVPFAGAGAVLQMLRTNETSSLAPGKNTTEDSELGLELVGGLDYRLGPGYLLGEVRGVYSDLDHVLSGDTNAGHITLSFGYRLTL